ncbi:hypothetical protein RB653_000208 [Dictyostelium firmibasis]|uniref:Uncharacterized protein n=1 Tax=Dictyostelium firmibasis TaxID=79012 RepID=A0AAN7U2H5_9MYCE
MVATLKKLSNKLKNLKSIYVLIPAIIILYYNNKLIYEKVVSKVNSPILDSFLIGYSREEAINTLEKLGDDGREIYKTLYSSYFDITFPIVLATTLISLLSLNYPLYKTSTLGIFNVLPIIYMIFDELENYCHFQILKYYSPLSTSIENYIFFGSYFCLFKYIFFFTSLVLLLIGIISNIILFIFFNIKNKKNN